MSCYNISGFYSHLPLKDGERIGGILCLCTKHLPDNGDIHNTLANGFYPVIGPFFGCYDDYGCIVIDTDDKVKNIFDNYIKVRMNLQDFIEVNYSDACQDLTIDSVHSTTEEERYIETLKRIVGNEEYQFPEIKMCKFNGKDFVVRVIYEHEDILKELIKIGEKYKINFLKDRKCQLPLI